MSKKHIRKFERELDKLFRARTFGIRSAIWRVQGAAPKVTKTSLKQSIDKLCVIAEDYMRYSSTTRKILSTNWDHKKQWHPKRGKGHGTDAKVRAFKNWYDKNITTKNCVYQFWNAGKCLYVGRTLNGKGRPANHFEKHWFSKVTRIDIFAFDRKRDVPRYECLLTHRDMPTYSKNIPSKKRYYTSCPICDARTEIRNELGILFRLR